MIIRTYILKCESERLVLYVFNRTTLSMNSRTVFIFTKNVLYSIKILNRVYQNIYYIVVCIKTLAPANYTSYIRLTFCYIEIYIYFIYIKHTIKI